MAYYRRYPRAVQALANQPGITRGNQTMIHAIRRPKTKQERSGRDERETADEDAKGRRHHE